MGTGRSWSVGTRLLAVLSAVAALAVGVVAINAASAADVTDPSVCVVEVSGSTATLSWFDTGGLHRIRRNNRWLATPGSSVSTFVDAASPPSATYVVRTWIGNRFTDRNCAPPPSTTTTSTSTTTSSTSTTASSSTTTTTTTSPTITTTTSPTTTTTTTSSSTTTTITTTITTTLPLAPPPTGCSFERNGSTVTLQWLDEGGLQVLRRDNRWLATPGFGASGYVDRSSPSGSGYQVRTWFGSQSVDRPCVGQTPPPPPPPPSPPPPPPPGDRIADRVIHVSIDGLRADHVTPELMPNLTRLMTEGASTLNARTDPAYTQTLPNHHSQFTGRSVYGAGGHQVDYNTDRNTTVHAEAGAYVSSVFDVVHDHGGSTLLYAGKSKFDMMDRNWNDINGAPDLVGADDGRDKIDTYAQIDPGLAVDPLVAHLLADQRLEYSFFHIRDPDLVGHQSAWASPEYGLAATTADAVLGQLVAAIEADPNWATSTSIIVVADHGGPTGGLLHSDETIAESYTIPFVVWGPEVLAGADLYDLNPTNRTDPGSALVPIEGPQPIRGHEVANLALELLGYTPVPGSTYNYQQDLAVN